MKFSKKIISAVLSLIIVVSAVIPCSVASSDTGLIPDERAAVSTGQFFSAMDRLNSAFKALTGKNLFKQPTVDINFKDGFALELCNYLRDNSGLDVPELCRHIPLNTETLEFFYSITGADVAKITDAVHSMRRKCDEEGRKTLSTILYFFENYLGVIKTIDVYTVPVGTDGTSRVGLTLTKLDGSTETMLADIFFSPDGLCYGETGGGILGLGFECQVYDLLIYATTECWMRSFGFCFFYDFFCYTTPFFNYITRRFKFEYADKEWMVQVWKGNYLVANGAEVGIYNRDKGKIGTYYDCYDGMMNMTLNLTCGDTLIYDISGLHWWLNGFKLGDTLYKPSSMTLSFSIELLDEEMANAFAESVNNHYRHDTSCTVDGKTVSVVW